MVGARSPTTQGEDMDLEKEQQWAFVGEKLAASKGHEKVIEAKERELQECIAKNYTRIKDVEKELAGLQFQLKLTSGPKRSALEMLRKKIELQSERVIAARDRFHSSRKAMEAAESVLVDEEQAKDRLCQELNMLVHQSAHAQLEKLEQLTQRLELLNGGMNNNTPAVVDAKEVAAAGSSPVVVIQVPAPDLEAQAETDSPSAGKVATPRPTSPTSPAPAPTPSPAVSERSQAELKAARQQAAAARARHVGAPTAGSSGGASSRSTRPPPVPRAGTPPTPSGPFTGF